MLVEPTITSKRSLRFQGKVLLAAFAVLILSAVRASSDPCSVPADTHRVYVRDFHAAADGIKDDGPAIRAALEAAFAGPKPVAVEFEAGRTYRVASFDDSYALQILDAKQVTLRGNGAELLLLPPNKVMHIEKSSDISICGLAIDYSPLPFTQGLVMAVDPAAMTFDLQIGNGFDVPTVDDNSTADNSRVWRFAVPYVSPERVDRRVQVSAVYATSEPRRIRIKLSRPADLARLEPNVTHLVMTMPGLGQTGNFAFRVFNNERVHFGSLRIYAVPQFTFSIANNLGPVSFTDVEQERKPETGRAMTGWRDVFHIKNNRAPVTWDGCKVEGAFDDSFNLSAIFQLVAEKLDDNRWRLRDLGPIDSVPPLRAGDRIQAIELSPERKLLGESRIQSIEQTGKDAVVTISPALPLKAFANDCKGNDDTCASRIMDLDAANEGSIIKGCTIHGSMRLRSKVTVDGVKLYGPLQITADPIRVGPLPNGIVVKNSEFNGPVRIGADNTERSRYFERWRNGERWAHNIVFENNRFMSAFRAEGASFSLIGNDIAWQPRGRFLLENSGPVRIKDLSANGAPVSNVMSRVKIAPGTTAGDIVIDGR